MQVLIGLYKISDAAGSVLNWKTEQKCQQLHRIDFFFKPTDFRFLLFFLCKSLSVPTTT